MNGLPPHHPMFDRNGIPPPAHHYPHPAYADALLNSRYAGMDPLLLQQEMRRQEMLAASGGYAAAAAAAAAGHHHHHPPHLHGPDSASALVAARREEELVRLHDAHNRIMEAELAARAMRDRVAAAQAAQAQAAVAAQQQSESYSIERIVALQEQEAARHRREIEKLNRAELSEQSGRAFGGVLAGPDRFLDGGAAAHHPYGRAMSSASNSVAASASAAAPHSPNQIAEEMAFRGRVHRRMLEEEAIKQRHAQHQAALNSQQVMMAHAAGGRNEAASAEREHLARLLQLQQMSDEDLIRRAAEVQNAQSAATLCDTLDRTKGGNAAMERELMEARLLRGSGLQSQRYPGGGGAAMMGGESGDARRQGLDMIDQAHADAAVARKYSGGSEKQSAGGDRQATPVQKKEQDKRSTSSPKEGKDGKPLRYFNNGIEVDMEGNPLPGQEPPAAATSNGKPSPVVNNLASLDNNIIAKFLTVVVSRVPEIAPAVADLLPDVGDPMLLKREFPNVVDATLAELRSIQERFANAGDANVDLHRRVTNCIAAIEPYKVDLSAASGMVPLPQLPPGAVPPSTLAAGMMSRALPLPLPEPSLDPGNCQPLLPNNPVRLHHHHHPLQGPVVSRPSYFPNPEDLAMAQQHARALGSNPNRMEGTFTPLAKTTPDEIKPKPESPSDDVPMMAAYKTTKKIEKIAKKQKKAKKKKKNRKPKLVHHALFRGALDMNSVMRKAALAKQREKAQQQRDRAGSESSSESCEDGKKRGSSRSSGSDEKSMPMKKRRISDEAEIDEADDSIHPISKGTRKKNKDNNNKRNPRGALLHQIFGSKKTTSPGAAASSKKENTGPNPKRSPIKSISKVRRGAAKSSGNEDSTNSVVTEESEDQAEDHAADTASQANADVDSHYDAANVLLGLMGK